MHLLSMWYLVRLYFLFICMLWWQRMWDKNSQKEREREKEKSLTIECVRVCWEAIPNIKMQGLLLAIAIFFLCLFYSISPNAEHKQTHNFPRCSCSHKGQSCLAFYDLFLAFDHNGKRCHWRDIWWESNHVNICWIQIPFSLVLNCVLTQIIIIKGVICAFCANFDELFLTNIDLIRYLQQKQCANDEPFLSVNGVFFFIWCYLDAIQWQSIHHSCYGWLSHWCFTINRPDNNRSYVWNELSSGDSIEILSNS